MWYILKGKKWKGYSLSCAQLFVSPWTLAHQSPVSMEFSRWECWSGRSLLQGMILTQGLNPSLLHYKRILHHVSPPTWWQNINVCFSCMMAKRSVEQVGLRRERERMSISRWIPKTVCLRSRTAWGVVTMRVSPVAQAPRGSGPPHTSVLGSLHWFCKKEDLTLIFHSESQT